jgi:multiple antibiotic resistance protein
MVALMSKRNASPVDLALIVAIAVIVIAITYAAMRASQALTHILGSTGVNAVGRVMGIIVAAIAVQLMLDGLLQVFPALKV